MNWKRILREFTGKIAWWLARTGWIAKMGLISECFLDDLRGTERFVEYPWILRNMDLTRGRILDVGCCGTLFPILLACQGFEVWGIDVKDYEYRCPNFRFVQGDILTTELPKSYFNRITLISTLEHIGLNSVDKDVMVVQRAKELLRGHGEIMLTFPYGRGRIMPGFRVYDAERLAMLTRGFRIGKKDFFRSDDARTWLPATEAEVTNLLHRDESRPRCIICLKLCV